MPDTPQEIATALKNCHNCKYAMTCELLAEWSKQQPICKLGVK